MWWSSIEVMRPTCSNSYIPDIFEWFISACLRISSSIFWNLVWWFPTFFIPWLTTLFFALFESFLARVYISSFSKSSELIEFSSINYSFSFSPKSRPLIIALFNISSKLCDPYFLPSESSDAEFEMVLESVPHEDSCESSLLESISIMADFWNFMSLYWFLVKMLFQRSVESLTYLSILITLSS